MNAFVDISARLVDPTAQAVWLSLYREVHENGVAKVSFNQIAERVGVSRRTVIRAVNELKAAKLVTVVARGTSKHGPSTYRVHGTPTSDAGDTTTSVMGGTKLVTPVTGNGVTGGTLHRIQKCVRVADGAATQQK